MFCADEVAEETLEILLLFFHIRTIKVINSEELTFPLVYNSLHHHGEHLLVHIKEQLK